MAINTLSNISSQEVKLTASRAFTSGQLISLTEGGITFACSTAISIPNQNVTTAGSSAVSAFALLSPSQSNYGQFTEPFNSVQLGNDVIAFAYAGDGTTGNTNINVSYLSQGFGLQQPATIVSTDTNIASVRILKLTSTTFVVAWTSTGPVLKFRIYNNDGTAVSSAVTVTSSITSTAVTNWNFAVTANSDIVIAYRKITSNDFAFTRYNSSGTIQGSEVIVESGSNPDRPVVLGHSNGDFWVYYYRQNATTAWKFARYNSSGTLQGSLTTVLAVSAGLAIQNWGQQIVELGNGSVLMWAMNASALPNGYIYDSTGALVASNTTWHGTPTLLTNRVPTVFVDSSTFTIGAVRNGAAFTIRTCNNSFLFIGQTISTAAQFGNISSANGYGTQFLFSDGSTGWTIYLNGNNGSTNNSYILSVNTSGATLGSLVTLYSAQGAPNTYGGHAFRTTQGLLCFTDYYNNSAGVNGGLYNTSRRSIIGVAQENAAVNANFRCATSGTYTITNVPLSPGYFDTRTATPGGCRGTIAGTTAILYGTT